MDASRKYTPHSMNPFESIDLNQSTAAWRADHVESSSDDGLDPKDFLSHQSRPEIIPETTTVPALLTSEELDTSAVFDSLYGSMYNLDSYNPPNFDSHNAQAESTIRYLRSRHDHFVSAMSTTIETHKEELRAGEDCSDSRNTSLGLFNQLSENCLQQCEIYTRELANTRSSLAYFQRLDLQRSRVLRRIKRIKSKKNEFGAKLDSLLVQRASIDEDIKMLEERLVALRAKRSTVDVEVDGTISVLESKSAKYVNYFRHLETSARSAIVDYLSSESLSQEGIAAHLKTEPVSVSFRSTSTSKDGRVAPEKTFEKPEEAEKTPKKDSGHNLNTLAFDSLLSPQSTSHTPVLTQSDIGIQALEIPEEISKIRAKSSSSAYSQGFDTASKQIDSLKKGVSGLVHVFKNVSLDEGERAKSSMLDDTSNTITEKVDFSPILQLLTSKIETLQQFETEFSKALHFYRSNSATWLDVCRFLEKQESSIFSLISSPQLATDITSGIQNILTNSRHYLKECLEMDSLLKEPSNFLHALIDEELYAVSSALERMEASHDDVLLNARNQASMDGLVSGQKDRG